MENKAQYYLIEKLGFTLIEADVYTNLIKNNPQTGYKLSITIGKSKSSIYQALKSLENKQAIMRLEGTQHGEYIPVSIEEFMKNQELEFKKQKEEIINSFRDISQNSEQDFIIRITKKEQLYSKIQSMISEAEKIILVDTDEKPLRIIEEWLNEKAESGIKILVETPEKQEDTSYTHIQLKSLTSKDIEWYAHWLCVSVDGEQFLISLLNQYTGELIHAIWCGNTYISPWVFNGMLHEFSFRALMQIIEEEESKESILEKIKQFTEKFFNPVKGFMHLQLKLENQSEHNIQ